MTPEPVDLRLVLGAVAGWIAVFLGLRWATAAVVAVGGGAAVAGGVLLLARRWRAAAALGLLLFCVAFEMLPLAGRLVQARASPLLTLAREHASTVVTLITRSDPVPLAATGFGGSPRVLVESAAEDVLVGGRPVPVGGSVIVLGDASGWQNVLPGQRARIRGTLQPDLGGSALSVTLSTWDAPELIGRPPWWQRMAGRIRGALRDAVRVLPDQERGLLPGLIDGDTSGLDPVLAERFRLAGLTHLVAVSGVKAL